MIEHPSLLLRTSDCSTANGELRSTNGDYHRGIDNGYLKGGVAVNLTDKTYTQARMAVFNVHIPDGVDPIIDFRISVWDYETQVLRATTDNLAAVLHALPRGAAMQDLGGQIVTADLLEPLSLREGEWVILGTATYGDYELRNLNLHSFAARKCMDGLAPQLSFRVIPETTPQSSTDPPPTGGYEGGEPGPIGRDGPTGNYPWVELL